MESDGHRAPSGRAASTSGSRVMIGLVAFIVVMSAVSLYLAREKNRLARASAPRTLSTTRLMSGIHFPSAVISPDGRNVAHVVENGDQASILMRQVSTITDLVIVPPAPDARYVGLSFSRDGETLYFSKYTGATGTSLYRVSARGGTPTKLLDAVDSQIGLSPDGRQMVFVREAVPRESSLVIANADGTGQRVLAKRSTPESFSSGQLGGPSWSPDGTTIASGVISLAGGKVVTVSVSDGKERPLTNHRWYQVAQTAWLPDGKALLVTAREGSAAQIWEVAYPSGTARRVLTDLSDYHGISLTTDARTLATIQSDLRSTISSLPDQPAARGTIAEHVVLIRDFR